MAYDPLIKNGLVVDGSGVPAFRGDVRIHNETIAEIGLLSSPATGTVDVSGLVVAPGFIDNHVDFIDPIT